MAFKMLLSLSAASLLSLSQAGMDGQILGEDPRKPLEVDADLICHSCQAVVKEVEKKLKHQRSAIMLAEVMETICHQDNFRIYDYIPPKMVKGCESFLDKHGGEEVEDALLKGGDAVADLVCKDACEGFDYKAPSYEYDGTKSQKATETSAKAPAAPKRKGKKKAKNTRKKATKKERKSSGKEEL